MKIKFLKKLLLTSCLLPTITAPIIVSACGTPPSNSITFSLQLKNAISQINDDYTKSKLTFDSYLKDSTKFAFVENKALSLLFNVSVKNPNAELNTKIEETIKNYSNNNSKIPFYFAASNWTNIAQTTFEGEITKSIKTFLFLTVMSAWLYKYHLDDTKKALENMQFVDQKSDVAILLNYFTSSNLISQNLNVIWLYEVRSIVNKGNGSDSFLVNLFQNIWFISPAYNLPILTNKNNYPEASDKVNFEYNFYLTINAVSYDFNLKNKTIGADDFTVDNILSNASPNSKSTFEFSDQTNYAIGKFDQSFKNSDQNLKDFLSSSNGSLNLETALTRVNPNFATLKSEITNFNYFPTAPTNPWTTVQKLQFVNALYKSMINSVFGPVFISSLLYKNYKSAASAVIGNASASDLKNPWVAYWLYLRTNTIFATKTLNNFAGFNAGNSTTKDCFSDSPSQVAPDTSSNPQTPDNLALCYAFFTYNWSKSLTLTLTSITSDLSSTKFTYNYTIDIAGKTIALSSKVGLDVNNNVAVNNTTWKTLY